VSLIPCSGQVEYQPSALSNQQLAAAEGLFLQIIAESCFGPAGVSGRFRVLAAGEGSIGGASILLFEHDAYGLSGGQTIVRVQDAPCAIS